MLGRIGVGAIEDLFDEIPPALRVDALPGVPDALPEMDIARLAAERALEDGRPLNFIGAGAYEHHIPAPVWALVTRGEIYSAYTPYQAEASQGTLQIMYEYQSMIAGLTGMDVSNASLYDGASALAEACLMAVRAHRRSRAARVLMPATVNPAWRRAARAITEGQGLRLEPVSYDAATGRIDLAALAAHAGEDITAIVVQQPNFFGQLEDVDALTRWARANGALVIAAVNPVALALLKPPGDWGDGGADIACGDAPALRRAAVFGRSLRRLHGLPHGARAPDAGTHRRPHRRYRGQARLHADPAGARAAHPPREGDLQHLHQPGPAGHGRDHSPGAPRAAGPRARRARLRRAHRRAGRGADGPSRRAHGFRGAAIPRGRVWRSTGRPRRCSRRSRRKASSAGSNSPETTRSSAMHSSSARPRRARPRTSKRYARALGERAGTGRRHEPRETRTAHLRAARGPGAARRRSTRPRRRGEVPQAFRRQQRPPLPEVSELQAVRHYTRLSQLNFSHRHALLSARLLHDEVQPAGLQFARDAAGLPRPPSARARGDGTGRHRLPVRAAGDAEAGDRHGRRIADAHGRRAGRIRGRRDDPCLSPRARRLRAQ